MKYYITILFSIILFSVSAQNVDFKNLISISLTKLAYDPQIKASRYNVTFARTEPRYDFTADTIFIDTMRTTYSSLDSNLVNEKLFTFLWDYYGTFGSAYSIVLAANNPPNELTLVESALTTVSGNNFLDNSRFRYQNDYAGKWVLIYNGVRYRMLATAEADRIRFRQVDANNQPVVGGFNGRIRLYSPYYLSLVNVVGASTTINFAPDFNNPGRFVSTTGTAKLWRKNN